MIITPLHTPQTPAPPHFLELSWWNLNHVKSNSPAEDDWENHKPHGPDGLHSNSRPWTSRGNLSCPGHIAFPWSVQSPVSRGCFTLSPLFLNPQNSAFASPLPQESVHLFYLPPTPWDGLSRLPPTASPSLPIQVPCSNNIALALLHHQFSFFHSTRSSSTVYKNAVTSPSWKEPAKTP